MRPKKTTVYVVDDDVLFRESLEELIRESGFEVRGFGSAEDFIAHTPIRHPACLVLDVYLPGIDGLALQHELRAKDGIPPVIFITGHGDIPMSVRAMKEGAVDFLTKPFGHHELLEAISRATKLDGQNKKREAYRRKVLSKINTLTPREKEVMRWVISGKLNKQIATVLGASEKTIRIHRGRVMRKLKVVSVPDMIRLLEKVDIVHPTIHFRKQTAAH